MAVLLDRALHPAHLSLDPAQAADRDSNSARSSRVSAAPSDSPPVIPRQGMWSLMHARP